MFLSSIVDFNKSSSLVFLISPDSTPSLFSLHIWMFIHSITTPDCLPYHCNSIFTFNYTWMFTLLSLCKCYSIYIFSFTLFSFVYMSYSQKSLNFFSSNSNTSGNLVPGFTISVDKLLKSFVPTTQILIYNLGVNSISKDDDSHSYLGDT